MAFLHKASIALIAILLLCTLYIVTIDAPTYSRVNPAYTDSQGGGTGGSGGGSGGGGGGTGGPASPMPSRTPTPSPMPSHTSLPGVTVTITSTPEEEEQPDNSPTPEDTHAPLEPSATSMPSNTPFPTPTPLPHADKCTFLGASEVDSDYWTLNLTSDSAPQSRTFNRPAGSDIVAVQGYWQWQGMATDGEPNESFTISSSTGVITCPDVGNSDRGSTWVYCGYKSGSAPSNLNVTVAHTGADNTVGDVGAQVAVRWCDTSPLSFLPITGELSTIAKGLIAAAIIAIGAVGAGAIYLIVRKKSRV